MTDDEAHREQPDAGDPGVLAALPSTRPQRLSRRARAGAPAGDAGGAAKPAGGAAKPAATPRKAGAAKPKKAATARKPAAKAKPKSKPRAAAARKEREPIPFAAAEKQRPRPVRPAHPTLEGSTGKAAVQRAEEPPAQSGVDLVKTVVQAAGEVAQIGVTVGGQILRRAVDKLPKKP